MMQCKTSIENFAETEYIFRTVLRKWSVIMEIRSILNILFEATNVSQRSDLTLSDFYGCCLFSKLKLQEYQDKQSYTNLATKLLISLENRKSLLLDNKAMCCSLLLDPRFKTELSAHQTETAKDCLADYWVKIKLLQQQTEPSSVENTNEDQIDLLETYFLNKGLNNANCLSEEGDIETTSLNHEEPDYNISRADFLLSLEKFTKINRLHHSASILDFWENQKKIYPELYTVATVFNSIPPSQATVERAFSVLSLIYNNKRYRLGQKRLEDILTVKLSQELVYSIFAEERMEAENKNYAPSD